MTNITEIAEQITNNLDGRTVTSHAHYRELLVKELVSALTFLEATHQQELEKNISLLRQWLNEDRIANPADMVTNEDLRYWLYPENRIQDNLK